jgi:hypothetical protein
MNQLIKNIRPWINELSTDPRIQTFVAAKLTSGILQEDAATISGISQFEKLIEEDSSVKLSILHNSRSSNQLPVIESLQKNYNGLSLGFWTTHLFRVEQNLSECAIVFNDSRSLSTLCGRNNSK